MFPWFNSGTRDDESMIIKRTCVCLKINLVPLNYIVYHHLLRLESHLGVFLIFRQIHTNGAKKLTCYLLVIHWRCQSSPLLTIKGARETPLTEAWLLGFVGVQSPRRVVDPSKHTVRSVSNHRHHMLGESIKVTHGPPWPQVTIFKAKIADLHLYNHRHTPQHPMPPPLHRWRWPQTRVPRPPGAGCSAAGAELRRRRRRSLDCPRPPRHHRPRSLRRRLPWTESAGLLEVHPAPCCCHHHNLDDPRWPPVHLPEGHRTRSEWIESAAHFAVDPPQQCYPHLGSQDPRSSPYDLPVGQQRHSWCLAAPPREPRSPWSLPRPRHPAYPRSPHVHPPWPRRRNRLWCFGPFEPSTGELRHICHPKMDGPTPPEFHPPKWPRRHLKSTGSAAHFSADLGPCCCCHHTSRDPMQPSICFKGPK